MRRDKSPPRSPTRAPQAPTIPGRKPPRTPGPLLRDELGYVQIDRHGAELLFQIITEREERAFASLDSLIVRQGSQHVLYGSALALAAALQSWARHTETPLIDLTRTAVR
jgi:hypothetical protein